jgi:mRNA-degrading endonuclease RelE of RelBE toxin-antitoxin system
MTKPCEKLFKKLPRTQQEWVHKRILEICEDPTCGDKLRDPLLKGLLHTHARGSASNLLIVWSTEEKPEKTVVIEGVGDHKVLDFLAQRRRAFGSI